MFCRNCGKGLVITPDKTCGSCGSNAVKATSFCRYCGKPTGPQDLTCSNCGSAIKPIPSSVRALHRDNPALIKLSKIVNLTIVAILVTAYIVFSLPPKVTKPITLAASDVVVATIGYTELPLHSISAYPPTIPSKRGMGEWWAEIGVTINTTQQLTVYAVFKNLNTENATKATRTEDVTDNSTYRSSNEKVATVTSGGRVRAVGPGTANITITYTAVPGSANMSSAAQGKTPITVTFDVPVWVTIPINFQTR
jgi:hypothetical protein